MTPNRRLDQLEPLVADALQKINRLIEGQGKLAEIVLRADQNAEHAAQNAELANRNAEMASRNAEIAAKGVADLTIGMQQGFADVRRDIADLRSNQELILQILRKKLP